MLNFMAIKATNQLFSHANGYLSIYGKNVRKVELKMFEDLDIMKIVKSCTFLVSTIFVAPETKEPDEITRDQWVTSLT